MTHARALAALLALSACSSGKDNGTALRIGVVLPFSGERAALGSNIERALIMAIETINENGGVAGQPLALDVADSHSDTDQSVAAAKQLIEQHGIQILIGPEESSATLKLISVVTAHDIINMQASLTPLAVVGPLARTGRWYRLTPDANLLGEALGLRMLADGVVKSSVVYDLDDYNIAFHIAVEHAFGNSGGSNAPSVSFRSQETDYSNVIRQLAGFNVQAVVLPAAPGTAVAIVEQWSTFSDKPFFWYFTPSLKTPLFVQNLLPGIVDNMIGIGMALGEDADAFAEAFSRRWSGDTPLDAAYFYYDALVIAALSWARASAGGGAAANPAIRQQLNAISRPSSTATTVRFMDLAQGLALARDAQPLVYHGVTGVIDFDDEGVAQRGTRAFQFWTIRDQNIVPVP